MSCHVLRSFLKPGGGGKGVPLPVGQSMLYSFLALRCYLASFILLQPMSRQEHNACFRLMEGIASNAVEGLLQSPSILSLQQHNGVRCSLNFLLLRLKIYFIPFNEVSTLTYLSVHSFMYDRACGCCTSSCYRRQQLFF